LKHSVASTDLFISVESVEETTRVLTEASISGKIDPPSLKLRRASHLRG